MAKEDQWTATQAIASCDRTKAKQIPRGRPGPTQKKCPVFVVAVWPQDAPLKFFMGILPYDLWQGFIKEFHQKI